MGRSSKMILNNSSDDSHSYLVLSLMKLPLEIYVLSSMIFHFNRPCGEGPFCYKDVNCFLSGPDVEFSSKAFLASSEVIVSFSFLVS